MSLVTEDIRATATQFYQGNHEICQEKFKLLLTQRGLPNGLLPVQAIEEFGFVEATGFFWIKQKKKSEYKFEKVGKLVQYAPEITAYVENHKIKKVNGVKAKELMMWITVSEMYVDDQPSGKITFMSSAGLSRSYPVSAFEIEEPKEKEKEKKEVKEV